MKQDTMPSFIEKQSLSVRAREALSVRRPRTRSRARAPLVSKKITDNWLNRERGILRQRCDLSNDPTAPGAHKKRCTRRNSSRTQAKKRVFARSLSLWSNKQSRNDDKVPSYIGAPVDTAPGHDESLEKLNEFKSDLFDMSSIIKSDERTQAIDLVGVIKEKDRKLKLLDMKLNQIQQGLISIEQERSIITTNANQLKAKNQELLGLLDERQREIDSLSYCCRVQNDKTKEASILREKNTELNCKVVELKSFILSKEFQIQATKKQLQENQRERVELTERLNRVKNEYISITKRELFESEKARVKLSEDLNKLKDDHSTVADKLRSCLTHLEKLNKEKQGWEEERRMRFSVSEEPKQLNNVRATIKMRDDLNCKNEKIQQLTAVLQDKSSTIGKLRKELKEKNEKSHKSGRSLKRGREIPFDQRLQEPELIKKMEIKHKEELAKMKSQLEKKGSELVKMKSQLEKKDKKDVAYVEHKLRLSRLSDHYSERTRDMQAEHDASLERLLEQLQEKDSYIELLETDVATHMQQCMEDRGALEKAKEESRVLGSITADVEELSHERAMLQEEVHEKDTEIAELSAEILKLEMEKELLSQDTNRKESVERIVSTCKEENETMKANFEVELNHAHELAASLQARVDYLEAAHNVQTEGTAMLLG